MKMKNEKTVLKELIYALNYIGLNWLDIMEDYINRQSETGQKSYKDIYELKTNLKYFEKEFNSEAISCITSRF